ncbi:PP2C-like domain-containing protein CG9801 isoform X3 [Phlebotomus papatasi]|uniref:PP2C-like domain-containing protein CG9801 isoform X3 n=1 Tax=Phlebotomus papatasi TaxID=29031 RepID=UPI002483D39A|nr:PP2C-like domain-containing protein CG9801 isoform X3 [Phlebotomus papatasi]
MPSLRQRVTTYFRQLSFIAEPREGSRLAGSLSPRQGGDGSFITKYLEGRLDSAGSAPEIFSGKEPTDLPDFGLGIYETGPEAITAACTGPDEGLTCVKRSRLHLSAGPDIDFIDTQDQDFDVRKSPSLATIKSKHSAKLSIQRGDQNANKSTGAAGDKKKPSSRKNSTTHQPPENVSSVERKGEKTTINLVVSLVSRSPAREAQQKTDFEHSDSVNQNTTPPRQVECDTEGGDESHDGTNEEYKQTVDSEPIAGVVNWKAESEHAYGLSVSLYEENPITTEQSGSPIADCFGLVARGSSAALALADGVNWGEGARLAARSAVLGCLEYLDTAIFGLHGTAKSTREVLVSLLRSFWEAHDCILESGGALSTLTVAVIIPLDGDNAGKSVVCACNVGDSLGYVYSKTYGVREFTQGSHDITSMRDMRDALGALGPVDGNKPELGNLTLSITVVEQGDIVFLTSDGISDNFDPVVGKFAEALTSDSVIEPRLASKRQNKSTSAIPSTRHERPGIGHLSKDTNSIPSMMKGGGGRGKGGSSVTASSSTTANPAHPIRPPRTKKTATGLTGAPASAMSSNAENIAPSRPKYMRSHTVIEPRNSTKVSSPGPLMKFPRSPAGLPLVTGAQRHKLTLLRLEDLLNYGINGTLKPCTSAMKLCQLLVDFAKMITAAKRKVLEQRESYVKLVPDEHGIRREVEMNRLQQRGARRRIVEGSTFQSLPDVLLFLS